MSIQDNNDQDETREAIYGPIPACCAPASLLNYYHAACQKAATAALAGDGTLALKWQQRAEELLDSLIAAWPIPAIQNGPSSDHR